MARIGGQMGGQLGGHFFLMSLCQLFKYDNYLYLCA
jgi:hypothetical protein